MWIMLIYFKTAYKLCNDLLCQARKESISFMVVIIIYFLLYGNRTFTVSNVFLFFIKHSYVTIQHYVGSLMNYGNNFIQFNNLFVFISNDLVIFYRLKIIV